MLLALAACTPERPAAPSAPVEVPSPPTTGTPGEGPERFVLVGRAAHEGLLVPSLPDGPALLGPACVTVNAALHGHGPPCLAERWRSDRREVLFRVANPRAALSWTEGPDVEARTTWSCLGPDLAFCLEDPLMVPPARDPGGERRFTGDGWEIRLSGANRCSLGGVLRVEATADRGEWSGLTVQGIPWNEGGRTIAHETVVAIVTPR